MFEGIDGRGDTLGTQDDYFGLERGAHGAVGVGSMSV